MGWPWSTPPCPASTTSPPPSVRSGCMSKSGMSGSPPTGSRFSSSSLLSCSWFLLASLSRSGCLVQTADPVARSQATKAKLAAAAEKYTEKGKDIMAKVVYYRKPEDKQRLHLTPRSIQTFQILFAFHHHFLISS